jgi:hypothetical protein
MIISPRRDCIMKLTYVILFALFLPGCLGPGQETRERIKAPRFELPGETPPPVGPPPRPGFVTFDAFEDRLTLDAQALSDEDANNAFYLVGCDRANINEELADYKKGVDKGINSLSTEVFIEPSIKIGNADCIFRIDQTDYGLSNDELIKVAARNPLNVISDTTRGDTLKFYLQKETTWAYADAFFLTAYEGDQLTNANCDTYCDIVEQEILFQDFLADEGINLQLEFDLGRAQCGGSNQSPIALGKSRLFCHVEGDNGWFSIAYDSSLAAPDSIQENPFTIEAVLSDPDLGPYRTLRSDKVFAFQAQEIIGTLRNGLQLFRLQGNDRVAASAAPADVVQNTQAVNAGLEGVIRLAACQGCHAAGPEGYRDELNPHINQRSNFNEEEKLLANVFYRDALIQQALNEIKDRHRRALAQLDIDSSRPDPFNGRLLVPLRNFVSAPEAAAKLFLTPAQYQACLAGSQLAAQTLGAHLTGGSTSLQVFADSFDDVIRECNLFRDNEL